MHQQDDAEGGFTLIEVLLSLAILGIAFAGILAGLATAAQGSDRHRRTASAETALRTWAEAVEATPYQSSCGTAVTKYGAGASGVNADLKGNIAAAVAVQSAAAGASSFGSCANGAALQKITLVVHSPDWNGTTSRDTETVDLVKYKP